MSQLGIGTRNAVGRQCSGEVGAHRHGVDPGVTAIAMKVREVDGMALGRMDDGTSRGLMKTIIRLGERDVTMALELMRRMRRIGAARMGAKTHRRI